jgi:hypothetical protein
VRRGELHKMGPNFALAIGNRVFHPAVLQPVGFPTVAERPGFLCVFADPGAEGFAELATALAPLHDRHGVWTILFPQGDHPDAQMGKKLGSLQWTVPVVYDFLSEAYTRTLIDEKTPLPALLLQTNEGRVLLLQSAWKAEAVPALTAALDAAFGGTSAMAPVVDPGKKP